MSPSWVHPAEVMKGLGGIFLGQDQRDLLEHGVDNVAITCSGRDRRRERRARPASACPHPHQTTLISGNLLLAPSAIYPSRRVHLLLLRSRSGSPSAGMSYATSI